MSVGDKLRLLLTVKGPSREIALTFAIGVLIGTSPFIGLHTVLGIVVATIMRLNRLIILLGVYVTNPWTIIPIYTLSTWIGLKITGNEAVLSDIEFKGVSIFNIFELLEGLIIPFLVGTLVFGLISSIASFFIILYMIRRLRGERG